MDILGIGPLELVFILIIALVVLGPRDIARFARTAGKALNKIYRSEAWGAINKASREFRDLPNRLAREAALDELDESIRTAGKPKSSEDQPEQVDDLNAWKPSPKSQAPSPEQADSEPPAPESEPAAQEPTEASEADSEGQEASS